MENLWVDNNNRGVHVPENWFGPIPTSGHLAERNFVQNSNFRFRTHASLAFSVDFRGHRDNQTKYRTEFVCQGHKRLRSQIKCSKRCSRQRKRCSGQRKRKRKHNQAHVWTAGTQRHRQNMEKFSEKFPFPCSFPCACIWYCFMREHCKR